MKTHDQQNDAGKDERPDPGPAAIAVERLTSGSMIRMLSAWISSLPARLSA